MKKIFFLFFLSLNAIAHSQDTLFENKIKPVWVAPEKIFTKEENKKEEVKSKEEVETNSTKIDSTKKDLQFLESLPKSYNNLPKDDLKNILVEIDIKLKKLTQERDSLLKSSVINEPLIKVKEETITTLNKEKNIVNLTIMSEDLKNINDDLIIDKTNLTKEREIYKRYLYISLIVLTILGLGILALLQRKKIKIKDDEIEKQLADINKKNSYLEHAARIIRHDMHSGINTYIPRGLISLEKRITEDDAKRLKIDTSIKMIKEGLEYTQKVYKSVYEFTNLVKKHVVLEKKEIDFKDTLENYLKNTSYFSQVKINDTATIYVNEVLFCGAVDNLIKNGLKYNDNNDKFINIYIHGDHLIIQDNGKGLTKKEFEKIINPEKDTEKDTGLGLTISNVIFNEHGFSMDCEKNDIGTKITIKINKIKKIMIDSILLVDDEDLFHLVFEDSCSLLDITLSLQSLKSSDEAAKLFQKWQKDSTERPECVFVDLNIIGSSFDGIELIRRINFEYGNNVVIGIISSSNEAEEQSKAIQAGAQFWIIKSDNIEPRLEEFKKDYEGYKSRKNPFKIYK